MSQSITDSAYAQTPSRGKRWVQLRSETVSSRTVTSSAVVTWKSSASEVIELRTSEHVLQSPLPMLEVAWKRTSADSGSPSRTANTVWLVSAELRSMSTKRTE